MKKCLVIFLSLIFLAALSACTKGVISCPSEDGASGTETPGAVESSGEESAQNLISSDMLSQAVYDALQAEWSAWNAKDEMQKMISSHMPGHVYKRFNTWAECEEFLGFELFNPLEDSEFDKGSYVGMPEGYNEAPRFYISYYGTEENKIDRIHVESGYRDGDVRITVNAEMRVDVQEEGALKEPAITEDSGENYVATTALVMKGPITYSIRVIGEPVMKNAVKETLEKVLPYFEAEEK